MRKRAVNALVGMAMLFGGVANAQPQESTKAQPKTQSTATDTNKNQTPANIDKNAMPSLEELLANALHNNPDIRVSEAKVREAEAELNRMRLQVMQKVITFRQTVEAQKAIVKDVELRQKRQQMLMQRSAISRAEVDDAQALLEREKAKLAALEAEMPSLLGKLPQNLTQDKTGQNQSQFLSPSVELSNTAWRDIWGGLPQGQYWQASNVIVSPADFTTAWRPYLTTTGPLTSSVLLATQVPPAPARGALADKLRPALDRTISLEIKDKSLDEALKAIQQSAGVPFHTVFSSDFGKQKLNLHLQDVPLGAACQAIEDSFPAQEYRTAHGGLVLAVRDYGILVTERQLLPHGATLLHDFWKGPKDGSKPKEGFDTPVQKNPPPTNVEGTVKAVASEQGLVTISVGSDAGLAKGQALEVYRLKPEPRYLGTVIVIDVSASEAVAKPSARLNNAIQLGDRVSSAILKK